MARSFWLASLALLAACRSFEVQSQQVFLRYRPDADVLDMVLAYEGVGARGTDEVDKTSVLLSGMAGGQRHFMIWDWPLDFDLAEMAAKVREDPPDDELAETARAFLEYEPSISVVASRFVRENGGRGRLCLLQRLRFEHGSRLFRLGDRCVSHLVLDEARHHPPDSFDPRTLELQLARANADGSWFRFEKGELVVSIPMSPVQAARELQELLQSAASHEQSRDTFTPQVLGSLTALHIGDEETSLRFAPAADGWIRFQFADDDRDYDPAVAEHIEADEQIPAGDLATEIERLKAGP